MLGCELADGGLGGISLVERALAEPYVKDHDDTADQGPERWPRRFDTSNWELLVAIINGEVTGGAALTFDTPGIEMLEGHRDLAVLWDLRVAPAWRGQGVGTDLFHAAMAWAGPRGCRQLKVETQNVNVPARRFYHGQGCVPGAIHRFAYPALPEEVQLLWYQDLA